MKKTLLRRLAQYSWDSWYGEEETILRLEEFYEGKVTIKQNSLHAVDDVVLPTPAECAAEFPWSKAENELAAYIVITGELNDTYGPSWSKGNSALGKMVLDGVSWEESHPPNDEVWSIWGGTFHEGDRVNKLTVSLAYKNNEGRYSWNNTEEFGIDMPSIADILKSASGYFLNKLDN